MSIISFKHKFVFVKTKKVAGTSIQVFLRRFVEEGDIVSAITPRDEMYAIRQGMPAQNFCRNAEDAAKYIELCNLELFDEATKFLASVKNKVPSHCTVGSLKK